MIAVELELARATDVFTMNSAANFNFDVSEEEIVICQKEVDTHLKCLNEAFRKLDSTVSLYKVLLKERLIEEYREKKLPFLSDTRLWWHKEIQNEMKLTHHYLNVTLKPLCRQHCCYKTSCGSCYQSCCNSVFDSN